MDQGRGTEQTFTKRGLGGKKAHTNWNGFPDCGLFQKKSPVAYSIYTTGHSATKKENQNEKNWLKRFSITAFSFRLASQSA
jgi:hypothetical protein